MYACMGVPMKWAPFFFALEHLAEAEVVCVLGRADLDTAPGTSEGVACVC